MIQKEDFWKAPDGTQRYTQTWLPDETPKAAVLIVHGLGEHSGRWAHVAEFFTAHDYAVMSFDLRGHGKSEGVRGDAVSFDQVCAEIDEMAHKMKVSFPKLPLFIYGHSLGGALALYYGFRTHPAVAGIVASAPGLAAAKPIPRSTEILGQVMKRLAPTFQIENGLDLSGLSRDEEVIRKYKADPLVHTKISARFGIDLIEKGKWILAQDTFPVPLLLIQGSADRVVSPAPNLAFAKRLKGDVTLRVFEGFYHEPHNEPEQKQVLQTIVDWMEAKRE